MSSQVNNSAFLLGTSLTCSDFVFIHRPQVRFPDFSHSFPLRVAGRDNAATQGLSGSAVGSLSGRWEDCFTASATVLKQTRVLFCFVRP